MGVRRIPPILRLVALVALVSAPITLLFPTLVAASLAVAMVFVLPGYAWSASLLYRCKFGIVETVVATIGISMTIVVLGGFLLNLTPWGLRHHSWTLLLLSALAAGVAVLWLKRRQAPTAIPDPRRYCLFTSRQAILVILTFFVTAAALLVAQYGANQHTGAGFTQFWLLQTSQPNTVRVGMRNQEGVATTYRLRITVGGRTLRDWYPIRLPPDSRWEAEALLTLPREPGDYVEATLYREMNGDVVYRRAHLRGAAQGE